MIKTRFTEEFGEYSQAIVESGVKIAETAGRNPEPCLQEQCGGRGRAADRLGGGGAIIHERLDVMAVR